MINIPQEAQAFLAEWAWHYGIVFLRCAATMSLLPAFGERSVPMRVKLGAAVGFSLIVAVALPPISPPEDLTQLAQLVLSETLIGFVFGIGIRLFVLALHTAGSIAAQATSLAQLLGSAAAEPLPAIGYVLVVSGLALATITGLHVKAAHLILSSYALFPVGAIPEGRALSGWGTAQVARCFQLAFTLAAPFVIASLIYNLTLGVINRAMPQLMVAFVGAPVATMGGLFILFVAAPAMLMGWQEALDLFLANPLRPNP